MARRPLTALAALALALPACGGDDDKQRRGPFVASDPGGTAVVWAIGDAADTGPFTRQVANLVRRGRPDRLLYLGDVYPRGSEENFDEGYDTRWGDLAEITAPTPGNHEWPTRDEGYIPYWKQEKGREPPFYYSFRLAGWQIISLNSEGPRDARSPQVRWLRDQVRGPGNCRLAFWHSARYSAGTVHGDEPSVEPFWQALEGKSPLVVTAHEHNMQRMKPIRGITQLISGAGGHSRRYPVRERDPRLGFASDDHNGALRLVLRAGRADYAFVDVNGRTLDSGSVRCRPR